MTKADPAALDHLPWRGPTSLLALAPLSLLVSLIVLTGDAWALTLYHGLSMSMPMGIVVRGGMAAEGLGGGHGRHGRRRVVAWGARSCSWPSGR